MNPRILHLLRASLPAILLISCEDPTMRQPPEIVASAPPQAVAPAQEAPVSPPPAPAESAAPAAQVPAPEENLPEAEPELSVAMVGNQILLSGALKSRLQVERINETLKREFPDHELKSDLKIESHRIPVGWGNRVDQYIVPYFQRVANGRITYRNTIVTLEGTVKSEGDIRMVSESAIETFSGSNTTDIDNKLKVEEPKS